MPYKPTERVYRSMAVMAPNEDRAYHVRGYASTFDRYLLLEDGDGGFYEQIDARAFDHADMADVILQYDHEGRVFARTSNGTLQVGVDDHGLWVDADLSRTSLARQLYEDIQAGMITRMSFCFTVADSRIDEATNTGIILAIGKVYDVSAVSIPANPGTEIEARSAWDGVILSARAERRERQARKRRMALRLRIMEVQSHG